MRVAALDLGSNTSLMLVAEVRGGEIVSVLRDETTVTRMGQGVHAARAFHPEALRRVDEALARYAAIIAEEGCTRVVAVATSAARDVSNAKELFEIGRRFQIPIHIVPGTREAELTFRGASGGLPRLENPAVIDVGGGSTEIIGLRGDVPVGVSVDIGSVRAHELFVTEDPVPAHELDRVRDFTREAFLRAGVRAHRGDVVAVAGTPTTLAMLDRGLPFDESFVHGYRFTRDRVAAWADRLASSTLAEREGLPGMPPQRADVMVCGSCILLGAMDTLGAREIVVSTRGVRYGVALAIEEFAT